MVDIRGDILRPPHCTTPAAYRKPMSECYAYSASSHGYTAHLWIQKPSKNSAGPGEAHECMYWLYKPEQTWVCANYPIGSFACSAFSHSYTVPLRIQKASKNLVGPHSMPFDYPWVPPVLAIKLSGSFM